MKRGILSVRVMGRVNACSPATVSAKVVLAQGYGKGNPVFFKFRHLFSDKYLMTKLSGKWSVAEGFRAGRVVV